MNIFKPFQRLNALLFAIVVISLTAISMQAHAFIEQCHPPGELDPLIIDLGQNGIHLGPAGTGVFFDLDGNGQAEYMQWTAPYGDEAFLILDKNGNGFVDDGSELFTNFNPLVLDGEVSPNGFADLARYDRIGLGGNDDGFITPKDDIWGQLKLWRDSNADGISTTNEMFNPSEFDINHFNTVPRVNNRRDGAGNRLPLWSWAEKDSSSNGNQRYKMVDVFFKPLFE